MDSTQRRGDSEVTRRRIGSSAIVVFGIWLTLVAGYDLEVRSHWATADAQLLCCVWAFAWIYIALANDIGRPL